MRDHQDVTCWHQHGHPSFSRLFSPHTMAGGRMSSGSRGCQKRNCARAALRVPVAAQTGGSARSALYVLAGSVSQAKTQRGEFANRGGRVSPVPAHPGVEHKLQFFSVCAQKRAEAWHSVAQPLAAVGWFPERELLLRAKTFGVALTGTCCCPLQFTRKTERLAQTGRLVWTGASNNR